MGGKWERGKHQRRGNGLVAKSITTKWDNGEGILEGKWEGRHQGRRNGMVREAITDKIGYRGG